ncbi:MAG: hypothetical protein WD226_12300 [Planctomycetota bacterium]
MPLLPFVALFALPLVALQQPGSTGNLSGLSPDEAVRVVERRLDEGLFQRDPWMARERGVLQEPVTLGLFGIAGRDVWRTYTDARRAEFGAIVVPRASLERKLEWNWVRGWLDAESTLLRARAMEQVDPLAYVRRAERTLAVLVDSDRPSPEARAIELNRVLLALPNYWKAAQRSLVNPRQLLAKSALDALPELVQWMHAIPEALGDMTWEPTFELLFEQHLRRALAETEAFRGWLEDTLLGMEDYQGTLDRMRWESVARSLTGRAVDAEELHARVLQETAELLMTLRPDDDLPAGNRDELEDALVRGSRMGWDLAREIGLFEGDLAVALVPRWTAVRGGLTPALHIANPRKDSIEVHQAIGTSDEVTLHPGIHPWRRTVAGQRVLGLRHGAIGEAWLVSHYVRQRADGERLWNEFTLGGLGLYATDWPLRLDPEALDEDIDLMRASLECRVEEALLLLAAIEIHAMNRTVGRVAESLAQRGGISRASATHLAQQALRDPLSGLPFLAYETLLQWEAHSTRTRTLEATLAKIYEVVAKHPTAHLNDLYQLDAKIR